MTPILDALLPVFQTIFLLGVIAAVLAPLAALADWIARRRR